MFLGNRSKDKEVSGKALEDARENLRRVEDRHDEVREVATALRAIREKNHFAEQLMIIMGGLNVGRQ